MHTLTYVILPRGTQDIRAMVGRLLAGGEAQPGREYPQHPRPCACIGYRAERESFAQCDADPTHGFPAALKAARRERDHAAETALLTRRFMLAKEVERAHPLYRRIDPECDICGGAGVWQASRDPRGHWDWWVIGGRWQRLAAESAPPDADLDDELRPNVAAVRGLIDREPPGAIVTPEGLWHEGPLVGNDGLFAALRPEHELASRQAWAAEAGALLEAYADHRAVIVDTHF